jgi:dihydroflavonol-4-reductase
MKILVTGATGFVGTWMCKKLLKEGHDVHILRRKSSEISELNDPRIQHHLGDVTDINSLKNSAKDMDAIFHLAGIIGYTKQMRTEMEKVNVEGTQNVLDVCKTLNIKKLVYMSSVVAVGASFDGKIPLNETSSYELTKLNLGYFETKHKAENLVLNATINGDVEAIILNPSTIYGPGDAKKGSRKTQIKVAQGKMPFYTSGGVSIIFIEDMVNATYQAFLKGKPGQRYILSGENITIKELFRLIAKAAGSPPPKLFLPNFVVHAIGFLGDKLELIGKKGPLNSETAWTATLYHWFDSSKAQRELDLKITPAAEAINSSVTWMKNNGLLSNLETK